VGEWRRFWRVLPAVGVGAQFLVPRGPPGDDCFVVAELLCGIVCPLTPGRSSARAGGAPLEPDSFVGRLVHGLLFVDLSPAVLCVCYVVFGLAVLLAFILAPPRRPQRLRKP